MTDTPDSVPREPDQNDNYPAEADLDWDSVKYGSMADYAEEE